MRYLLILFYACLFFCCKTQKEKTSVQMNCPENGTCHSQKHENKSLNIKKDDIGGIYYQIEESTEKTVFIFSYNKDKNPNYKDGHYNEEIIFELNNYVFNQSFENLKLEKVLFGVFCYCKGKAGYYILNNAIISFDKETKNIKVAIEKMVENQVLSSVKFAKE